MQGTETITELYGIQMHYYSLIDTENYNKAEDFSEPISTDIECKYDLIK